MFKDTFNNTHIKNDELMELMKNEELSIIDVREVYEYNICHIPGSILIPLQELIRHFQKHLNKETTYYILCHTGQRSYYVTDFLTNKGYSAINIIGGIADNDKYNVPY